MLRLAQHRWRRTRRLVTGLAFVALISPAGGRASEPLRWRWCHPEPHGNNIKDMARSEASGLWVQVAEQGTLYTSRDGFGWIPRNTGTRMALRSAAFLSDRLLITGEAGTVLYADSEFDIKSGVLLDGPTGDWLEGVAASPTLAVTVGDNGCVYTSTNGVEWSVSSSGVTEWLRDVAHGGDRFVAVGESGTVLSSSDGVMWIQRSSGVQEDLNCVEPAGGGFLVAGNAGAVLFSSDGVQWQKIDAGSTNDLFTAGASGLDAFVAGEETIRVRVGGQWLNESTGPNRPTEATYLSSLGLPYSVFLGGRTGTMIEGFRLGAEPYEWFLRTTPDRPWLFDLAWATNLFVAVGDQSTIMTSVDGVTWAFEFPPTNYLDSVFLGVGGTTNLLIGAGSRGSLMISPHSWTNIVVTNEVDLVVTQEVSTLGVVWYEVQPSLTTEDLQGVCYWGDRYYVTGGHGTVLNTDDGTNWVEQVLPTSRFLSGIAGYPGGVVVVGDAGAIYQSADGIAWTDRSLASPNWLYKVRYVNGQLIAVGQGGLLVTSPDGITWDSRGSGTTNWLTDVTWVGDTFYVTGLSGTLLRSDDALTWDMEGSITFKPFYGAAADGERLIVAGAEGVILRSPVALPPNPVEILQFSRALDATEEDWEQLYLFGGVPDQRFTLDRQEGLDGGAWITGRQLEITGGAGTLLFLESVAVTNAPPNEYYQTTLVP